MGCVGVAKCCTKASCGILILYSANTCGFLCSPEYFVMADKEFVPFVSFVEQNLLFSEATSHIAVPSTSRNDECFLCRRKFQYHFSVLFASLALCFICTIFPVFLLPILWAWVQLNLSSFRLSPFLAVPEGAHSWSRGTRLDLHGPWSSVVTGLAAVSASLPFDCLWADAFWNHSVGLQPFPKRQHLILIFGCASLSCKNSFSINAAPFNCYLVCQAQAIVGFLSSPLPSNFACPE